MKVRVLFGIMLLTLMQYAFAQVSRVALLPFEALRVEENDAKNISYLFETCLQKTKVSALVEMPKVENPLIALLKKSDQGDREHQAVEIGKSLNVDHVIIGAVGKLDRYFYLTVESVDVETAEYTSVETIQGDSLSSLVAQLDDLVFTLTGVGIDWNIDGRIGTKAIEPARAAEAQSAQAGVSVREFFDAGQSASVTASGAETGSEYFRSTHPSRNTAGVIVAESFGDLMNQRVVVMRDDPDIRSIDLPGGLRRMNVWVEFVIGPNGIVESVTVEDTGDQSLNERIKQALRRWKFEPIQKDLKQIARLLFVIETD